MRRYEIVTVLIPTLSEDEVEQTTNSFKQAAEENGATVAGLDLWGKNVNYAMRPDVKSIREWIGNDEMFKNLEKGTMAPWRMYRKAGIRLKQNYLQDHRGSIMLVNQMFRHGLIHVHTGCTSLFSQMREGRKIGAKIPEHLGLVSSLCLIVTRLKKLKQIHVEHFVEGTYGRKGYVDREPTYELEQA